MSGGVDSSVAAVILKIEGFDVIGVHLKISKFCNPQDEEDARAVANILNIPFYVIDITKEYQETIALDTIKNYAIGLTPNPDVLCNRLIKFGYVYDFLKKLGMDYIATGHYAKKEKIDNEEVIKIPKDKNKDQTYFLWSIKKQRIKRILFPLGDFTKEEVRKLAKDFNLPVAEKKDSQGICFLGPIKLIDFLREFLPEHKGLILNTKGEILGYHSGYYFFTEGQRHGLNIKKGDGPYYVALKDPKTNYLIVAKNDEKILYSKKIKLKNVNLLVSKKFIDKIKKENKIQILSRCRYRHPLIKSVFDLKTKILEFKVPVKATALGQSAVFYYDDILLGGGIIDKRL